MAENAPELEFLGRVANPAAFADVSDDRGLKVLSYRASEGVRATAPAP